MQEPRYLGAACYFAVHENGGPELLGFFVQPLNLESQCFHQLFQLAFLRPREYVLNFRMSRLSMFHESRQGQSGYHI